jgi:hypothetical protein
LEDESIKLIEFPRPKLADFFNNLIPPSTPFPFDLSCYPSEGSRGQPQVSSCKPTQHTNLILTGPIIPLIDFGNLSELCAYQLIDIIFGFLSRKIESLYVKGNFSSDRLFWPRKNQDFNVGRKIRHDTAEDGSDFGKS